LNFDTKPDRAVLEIAILRDLCLIAGVDGQQRPPRGTFLQSLGTFPYPRCLKKQPQTFHDID
jgi:hypothetical protein